MTKKTLLNIQGAKESNKANTALKDGNHDKAILGYNAAIDKYLEARELKDDPDNVHSKVTENLAKAYQNLIGAHMGKDDFAAATDVYDKIDNGILGQFKDESIFEGIAHNVSAASHKHAQALFADRKFEDASSALEKALTVSSGFDTTKFNLSSIFYDQGRAEFEQGNFKEARKAFQEAIKLEEAYTAKSSLVLSSYAFIFETDKELKEDPKPNLEEAFEYLKELSDEQIREASDNSKLILVELAMIKDFEQEKIAELSGFYDKLGLPDALGKVVVNQALAHNTDGDAKTCVTMLLPLQDDLNLGSDVSDYLYALHLNNPNPDTPHTDGAPYVIGEFKFVADAPA